MSVWIYGRMLFLVDSHSRPLLRHLVDLEPELDDAGQPDPEGEPCKCSCESFNLRVERPCRHIEEVIQSCGYSLDEPAVTQPEPEPAPEKKKRIYHLKPR